MKETVKIVRKVNKAVKKKISSLEEALEEKIMEGSNSAGILYDELNSLKNSLTYTGYEKDISCVNRIKTYKKLYRGLSPLENMNLDYMPEEKNEIFTEYLQRISKNKDRLDWDPDREIAKLDKRLIVAYLKKNNKKSTESFSRKEVSKLGVSRNRLQNLLHYSIIDPVKFKTYKLKGGM